VTDSARTVFGFDRRLEPFMTTFRFDSSVPVREVDCGPPYPATISPEIWRRPKNIEEIPSSQLNEFNLLFLPDESAEPSVTVAFSVAEAVLNGWPRSPHIVPVTESILSHERGWRALGYDVVDRGLQLSALYGLHMLRPGVCDAVGVGEGLLNRFGLVPTLEIASALKMHFDSIDPAIHAFFQIVKVHVKINSPL
jgi:hypothetical protein